MVLPRHVLFRGETMTEPKGLCWAGRALYKEYKKIKAMPAHGVWLMLKLADEDDAWEDYQKHVKECEICREAKP